MALGGQFSVYIDVYMRVSSVRQHSVLISAIPRYRVVTIFDSKHLIFVGIVCLVVVKGKNLSAVRSILSIDMPRRALLP